MRPGALVPFVFAAGALLACGGQPKPAAHTPAIAVSGAQATELSTAKVAGCGAACARPSVAQARVFIQYARHWDTPQDDEALQTVRRLRQEAPTWKEFAKAAPEGSRERAQVERFLVSMDQAGFLTRAGLLHEAIITNAWYDFPSSWAHSKPWVVGLRAERNDPHLYERYEWLADRTLAYRDEVARHPPPPPAPPEGPPTFEDTALFYEFASLWNGPRDVESVAVVARLVHDVTDYDAFKRLVPLASATYTAFDRYYCLLDQAGVLVRTGVLRADLVASLRDAASAWANGKKLIEFVRRDGGVSGYMENLEWLAQHQADLTRGRR